MAFNKLFHRLKSGIACLLHLNSLGHEIGEFAIALLMGAMRFC
ncbi:hypothetical protein [Nostoc sp. ChiSLP03a]|nr:hypothetical protein [Nostoc sp. ChiSLP03a]MDZ8214515.1 hypothetical protein [Nostoc sp. ChiSLP03a]